MTDTGPPAEQHLRPPGWYRVTRDGWVRLCGPDEEPAELGAAVPPLDLVKVDHDVEEVPLW